MEGSLRKKIGMNIPIGEEKLVISDQGGRNSLFTLPQNITLFPVLLSSCKKNNNS
jgi:hypothetical protein